MLKEKLHDLRIKHGITQADLAAAVGVSSRAVKYWEHGERTPNLASLLALARYFNVSTEYFLMEY